jgi:hypothetical protein
VWVLLAGTPVQQSFYEWQQYLKILSCEPFYHNMTWKALCWRPMINLDPMGLNCAKCEPCPAWRNMPHCAAQRIVLGGIAHVRSLGGTYASARWCLLPAPGGLLTAPSAACRALLSTFMVRRTKLDVTEQINLPPCTFEDRIVRLTCQERACYERLWDEWQLLMVTLREYLEDRDKPAKDRRHYDWKYAGDLLLDSAALSFLLVTMSVGLLSQDGWLNA